jgi:hypothetical protein
MVKSIGMRWACHLACKGRRGMNIGFRLENQNETDQWEDLNASERIVLKWILERSEGVVWILLISLRVLVKTVINLRFP